ncbi:MAG TPA: DUF4337 domain-containing protein [Roseiarcus sp.]|nr:DUF4337 domain-containing protein [Roseiarcus sp.]
MSEHVGVHTHAAHEELLHEMAEHGAEGLAQRVAIVTALLATIGALFGYQAGHVSTEAMLLKNDSIAAQAKASDMWAEYQAKSTREFLSKNLAGVATDDALKTKLASEGERYAKEKQEISEKAKAFEEESKAANEKAEANIVPHERMALGVTLMQVAVALASITVLTRKNWLFYGALAFAAIGIGVSSWGYFS